ncbi:hypothetical protein PG999_012106 [Apiospora kogelbergensis]|uniref:Uncharacterized protein n=1 Tax=Apiospora kogelbergensis TaxID=1337665 RepID=A0AAW0QG86_9PEZI
MAATESSNSSDTGEIGEFLIPCHNEDILDVSYPVEAVQESGSSSAQESIGAVDGDGLRIHFHPEFDKRRDSVDFHETMHEEYLI